MLYKKVFLGLFFGLICTGSLSGELQVEIESEGAILVNASTGAILYEKNANELYYPASITKIATTLYVLHEKESELSHVVAAEQESIASIGSDAKKRSNYTMPAYWIEKGSTHMGIKKGEEFTLKDLLSGVMIASANDASNVVAQWVGGSIPDFIERLNEYVQSLGCKNTHFTNPHGLHHPEHQTTPYDMAIMTREAMKNPIFREMVSSGKFIRPKTNKQESTVLLQTNRLIRKGKYYYPEAIGVKTGYTSIARHTLVAAAKRGDRELIAVLMKCNESGQAFNDAIKLFDAAFSQNKVQKTLIKSGPQKFNYTFQGIEKPIKTYTKNSIVLNYYPAEEPKVKCYLQWLPLKLPILKDQQVGEILLSNAEGTIVQKVPLYATEEIEENWLQWIKNFF